MKQPCARNCPDRNAECHAKCEKWAIYEKERNEEYARIGREKYDACIQYEIERDRKRDVAIGRMKNRRNAKVFKRY